MSTRFELDNRTHIEFGVEICEKFQKFLRIIETIHNNYKLKNMNIHIFDDHRSYGSFSLYFAEYTLGFHAMANNEGFSLSFKNIHSVTGIIKNNELQEILKIGGNFTTAIKKPRYEVFESVMKTFCEAMNIRLRYFCG